MAEATVYLHVEPSWSRYSRDLNGDPKLAGIKVARVTQTRPKKISGVVVKLKLCIPDAAFKPLSPEVVIDVPESALAYEPIVTVEMPDGED